MTALPPALPNPSLATASVPAETRAIVLVGMPATGKSTVGARVAAALGWAFVDLDAAVTQHVGQSPADILRRSGEAVFRLHEAEVLDRVLHQPGPLVLAAGGGTPCFHDGLARMRAVATVLWLDAPVETLVERTLADGDRPLLGHTRLEQTVALRDLARQRTRTYALAHGRVDASGPLAGVIARVLAAVEPAHEIAVTFEGHAHTVVVHAGTPADAADRLAGLVGAGTSTVHKVAFIIDRKVRMHAEPLAAMLEARGVATVLLDVAGGEKSKDIRTATRLWQELALHQVDRGDVIVGIGGGATTDLAGFVAATWMRGVRYVALPTSVLAMADASVGGKTALDLPAGKNLIGAFHVPSLVWLALGTLDTLPGAEWRSGLAEIAKIFLAYDADAWQALRADHRSLRMRSARTLWPHLCRAVALKAAVVARDPREAGERALLNLGHTLGHALEAESGYTLRHGEAVALGLVAAAEVSALLLPVNDGVEATATEVRQGLADLGLPVAWEAQTTAAVLARLRVDKKARGDTVRYIALRRIGQAEIVTCSQTTLVGMLTTLAAAGMTGGGPGRASHGLRSGNRRMG